MLHELKKVRIIGKSFFLFLGLSCLFGYNVYAKDLVIAKDNYGEVDISGHLSLLVDTHAVFDWDRLPKEGEQWHVFKGSELSGGLISYVYWYKTEIQNLAKDQYLILSDPLIDQLDVYFSNDSGLIRHSRSGCRLPFEERELGVTDYCFLLPQGSYSCYIRIKKITNFRFPLVISSRDYLMKQNRQKDFVLGLFFGVLLVVFLYNLFVYYYLRERIYLYYIFYLCFITIFISTLNGVFFQYLWPTYPYFNLIAPSYSSLCLIAASLFVMSLFQVKIYIPKSIKVFYTFNGIAILTIVVNLFLGISISSAMIQFTGLIFAFYLIFISIIFYEKNIRLAKFFLFSWGFYMSCCIIFVMQNHGYIESNTFTRNSFFFGAFSEIVLFSIILVYRLNISRKEKEKQEYKEKVLVLSERDNRIKILSDQHDKIKILISKIKGLREDKKESDIREVQEREDKNVFLREQAHEIKNPVNWVVGAIQVLNDNVRDILHLMGLYRQLPDSNKKSFEKEIQIFEDEIDVEVTVEEISKSLVWIQKAIDRVREVAENLSTSAQPKEILEKIKVDVNECLKSTITAATALFDEQSIQLRMDFGDVPHVESYRGKLNQVFTNLIKNALEAILEKPELNDEFLCVKTSSKNDKVIIELRDSGVGMSKETQERLFEKFYTTKASDIGTGLGMGICKYIIENHKGTIAFDSGQGKGTTFVISLPIQH